MSTIVYTESTCDRCGGAHRRHGAEGVPPVGWASFSLSYRAEGDGWSGGGKRITKTMCPQCAHEVEVYTQTPAYTVPNA